MTPDVECADLALTCKDCGNAHTSHTDGDKKMQAMGYKTCKLARTEVERATYFRGSSECMWPERVKCKEYAAPQA